MDTPLQAILIAGETSRDDVIQGHATATIRCGFRAYKNGPVMIGCHILNWCVLKKIIDVQHFLLKDVPLDCLKKLKYTNTLDIFNTLHKFYPSITVDSEVTFVEWM